MLQDDVVNNCFTILSYDDKNQSKKIYFHKLSFEPFYTKNIITLCNENIVVRLMKYL